MDNGVLVVAFIFAGVAIGCLVGIEEKLKKIAESSDRIAKALELMNKYG